MIQDSPYIGTELDLFSKAVNWNDYVGALARPFISGRVLEVGAGIGGKASFLLNASVESWLALEPDGALAQRFEQRRSTGEAPALCRVLHGKLADLPPGERFDSVLYLDVIEHIEDDREELANAAERLSPGGTLLVLVPAHQFLFSPFDAAIGHWRRYDRAGLLAAGPQSLDLVQCRYLDSIGLFASLANKVLLRASSPSASQIGIWDRGMVPLSKMIDPLLAYRFGKSLLAIWRKPKQAFAG